MCTGVDIIFKGTRCRHNRPYYLNVYVFVIGWLGKKTILER